MPNMTLLPDGTGTFTAHWSVYPFGTTRHDALDDDNGDTSYAACSADGRSMVIVFANPSVAEADIDTIDSVRFLSSGRHTGRSGTADVDIEFEAPAGVSAYSETADYDASPFSYESISGTARTTSDGSNAWTYSDLEGLEMKCTKNGSNQVRLSYLALRVSYTEAVTADNATFFGANF